MFSPEPRNSNKIKLGRYRAAHPPLNLPHIVSILTDMRLVLLLALSAVSALAQESLRQQIRAIALEARGKVSVACSLPRSALNCDLNPNARPPMQSVFKLPLALTVLHQVEQNNSSLDQSVRFLPQDRILP